MGGRRAHHGCEQKSIPVSSSMNAAYFFWRSPFRQHGHRAFIEARFSGLRPSVLLHQHRIIVNVYTPAIIS